VESALTVIPSTIRSNDVTQSGKRVPDPLTAGKMYALDRMLHSIHRTSDEKVVVVSNWTATLNVIQDVCKLRKYPFLRLDGSTPAKSRQPLVDQFNRQSRSDSFVFLLSAKAGGVGLNLIGYVEGGTC
jgi:DNA repair and recombination protein RAD54B